MKVIKKALNTVTSAYAELEGNIGIHDFSSLADTRNGCQVSQLIYCYYQWQALYLCQGGRQSTVIQKTIKNTDLEVQNVQQNFFSWVTDYNYQWQAFYLYQGGLQSTVIW